MSSSLQLQRDIPEEKIAMILQEAESGVPVRVLCRRHGITELAFYRWKGRPVRIGNGQVEQRVKSLEEELRILRRLIAFQALDVQQLRERLDRTEAAVSPER